MTVLVESKQISFLYEENFGRRVSAEEKKLRIMNKREEKLTYSIFDSLGKNIAALFIFAVWTGRFAVAPDRSVGEDRPAGVVGVEDRVVV